MEFSITITQGPIVIKSLASALPEAISYKKKKYDLSISSLIFYQKNNEKKQFCILHRPVIHYL